MIDWGVHRYMCIVLALDVPSLVWWYSRHLCSLDLGDQSAMGISALFYIYIYIYIYIYRSAKFVVAVFKASMLD